MRSQAVILPSLCSFLNAFSPPPNLTMLNFCHKQKVKFIVVFVFIEVQIHDQNVLKFCAKIQNQLNKFYYFNWFVKKISISLLLKQKNRSLLLFFYNLIKKGCFFLDSLTSLF
jgi:hypothetical protein